jgi:hypothetical protein
LHRTLNAPDAERDRLDYVWLAGLLNILELARPENEKPGTVLPFPPQPTDQ